MFGGRKEKIHKTKLLHAFDLETKEFSDYSELCIHTNKNKRQKKEW